MVHRPFLAPLKDAVIPPQSLLLIVDDERTIVDLLVDLLSEDMGYAVVTAGHGGEAVRQLKRARPDLVITDVQMPVMDGWELCAWLQATPGYERIPVIIMSAHAQARAEDSCSIVFVRKPFQLEALQATIQALLAAVPPK